jgi:uncharacterized protein (TIGR03000 family)
VGWLSFCLLEVNEMYSVVLMMAMSGGAEVPDFGRRGGCHGCNGGCHGVVSHGCHGDRHGCWGDGCRGGCRGGGFLGGLFRKRDRGCHGCHGCHGVSHGCHGAVMHGCHGGCVGGHGCHGGTVIYDGGPRPMPKKGEVIPPPKKGSQVAAPATIIVTLPADASLMVDGTATTSTSARRMFVSPMLEPESEYVYTLRAEIIRDGQTLSQEQRINVRAGQETVVPFNFATPGVATSTR